MNNAVLFALAAKRFHDLKTDVDHLRAETAQVVKLQGDVKAISNELQMRVEREHLLASAGEHLDIEQDGTKFRFLKSDGEWGPWLDCEDAADQEEFRVQLWIFLSGDW